MVVALLIVVVGPDHSRPVWAELWFCVLQKYHVFQCRNGQDFMGEIFACSRPIAKKEMTKSPFT